MTHPVYFLSYPYLTDVVRSVIREREYPFSIGIKELKIGDPVTVVEQLDRDESVQVIITVRGHARFVSGLKRTAAILLDVSGDDLLHAFRQVKPETKEIVMMRYGRIFEEYTSFDHLFPFRIHHDTYRDEREAVQKIKGWLEKGIRTFVGTSAVCNEARRLGAQAIFLYSKKSIAKAFERAAGIIQLARKDREKLERINAIIQNASNAILAVDPQGRVERLNRHALRLLGKTERELCGQPIRSFLPDLAWEHLLSEGESVENALTQVDGTHLILNMVPIRVDGQNLGGVITFQETSKVSDAETKIRRELHRKGLVAKYRFSDIIHRSRVMKHWLRRAKIYAETDATVLIQGETGTGKELIAQSIHNHSGRRNQPFVAVNCSALPESLLESELFGYEDGAFTGAKKGGKRGLFELAHRGTLFLDEIGELSPNLQARLLRALQEREIMRIGGDSIIPVDVRIIAATNKDLRGLVEEGSFREDLYYRLNMLFLHLPPLRERREDIPLITESLLKRQGIATSESRKIARELVRFLFGYSWKGNVRELENVVHRIAVLYQHAGENFPYLFRELLQELVESDSGGFGSRETSSRLSDELKKAERANIMRALREAGGNKAMAARKLGVSRTTLWRKLRSFEEDG
ncbi:MAG: sigma 54-interacting transcriptional regulator [Planifilum fimeticola]